jgi:hypothetical protein
MTEEQDVWDRIRLLSAGGQPTKAVLAQTCMGAFLTRSVSDTIFALFFFRDRLRTSLINSAH